MNNPLLQQLDLNTISSQLYPKDSKSNNFPWLWLGTWSLGGQGYGKTDLAESKACIDYAIDRGIRYFDTAEFYAKGRSHSLLSSFIILSE